MTRTNRTRATVVTVAQYHKVLFYAGDQHSASLVVDARHHDPRDMSAISRLFPGSAFRAMRGRYVYSPAYPTFDQALGHDFGLDGAK
jgi:hypothetical protein